MMLLPLIFSPSFSTKMSQANRLAVLTKQGGGPGVDAQLVGDGQFLGEELAVRQFFCAHRFAHAKLNRSRRELRH